MELITEILLAGILIQIGVIALCLGSIADALRKIAREMNRQDRD